MKKDNSAPKSSLKSSFKTDAVKMGGSQVILCAAAIVIAVLINLIAAKLPATMTKFDMSSGGYFTLSEQSEKIVSGLEEPVTLYLIAETGTENSTITSLLDQYKAAGSNLKIEYVDPVLHPTFTSQYEADKLAPNSIIVESAKRYKTVDNSAIFVTDFEAYYTTGKASTSFDGEGAITSAISYVISDDLPTIYTVEGHGENPLSPKMASLIIKDNYNLSPLNLVSAESVPEDCDALIMVSPKADITERELEMILDYMEQGGNVLLFSDLSRAPMPNMDALLDAYGLETVPGVIVERDDNHYMAGGYYNYLLPAISSHEITASTIEAGHMALMPISQGINITESHRSSLNIQPLLTTTADSYLRPVTSESTTIEKVEGDIEGPFYTGVAVTEEVNGGTTRLVVYSTSAMLEPSVDQIVYSANSDLALNTMAWMCDYEQGMSIHAKPVDDEVLVMPASATTRLGLVVAVLLPLGALACGAYVTLSRRKK